jgi:hypothetical protein
MNQEIELMKIQCKMESIESLLNAINRQLSIRVTEKNTIGDDWVDQDTIMKLTGLGRTKLYELRKENKISSSTICGKDVFYRLSDFKKLLNTNEKNR